MLPALGLYPSFNKSRSYFNLKAQYSSVPLAVMKKHLKYPRS